MNIKLIYNKSSFNVDIMNDTPCQYLFDVTHKIFRIPIDQIMLIYEGIEIKNNSRLVFSVMGKTDPDNITGDEVIIVSNRKKISKDTSTNGNNNYLRNSNPSINYNDDNSKLPLISSPIHNEKLKLKKKGAGCVMKCQICNHKNSIFYCRVCNLFICFECNVRFNEHRNHERINLEDGDSFLGCDVYREEIMNEIDVIELGYQKTLEWMIDNQDRENFLQNLFKSLEQIRNNSLNLADMKTLYNLDQDTIDDFRSEVDKIPKPKHREDVYEAYGNLNLKENELRNYTKFLNLQIIKTEYNKVLLKCLDKVKKNIDKLSVEVKSRLSECEDIKFRGLEDVQLYLKESKLEKNQMTIGNYLSKDYVENNNQVSNLKTNLFLNARKNNNNNNTLNSKNSINNFNIYYTNKTDRKMSKEVISLKKDKERNISIYEKDLNKTIDKKNMPIRLVDNEKKKIKLKEIDLNNNNNNNNNIINGNNEDKFSTLNDNITPLRTVKKKLFKINDNIMNKIIQEKPKVKKINITTVKQQLSEADINDKNGNKINQDESTNNNNDIKNKLINSNTVKRYELPNKMLGLENDLIKPEDDTKDTYRSKLNIKESFLKKFTNSEKKILLNPPSRIKNNSYGKTILKKNSVFDKNN